MRGASARTVKVFGGAKTTEGESGRSMREGHISKMEDASDDFKERLIGEVVQFELILFV
jgi:hypothetical protein